MTRPFRDAVKDALNSSGLSIRALAEGAGVSEDQLKKFLSPGRSHAKTNADDAAKIAKFLDISLQAPSEDEHDPKIAGHLDVLQGLHPKDRAAILRHTQALEVADQLLRED